MKVSNISTNTFKGAYRFVRLENESRGNKDSFKKLDKFAGNINAIYSVEKAPKNEFGIVSVATLICPDSSDKKVEDFCNANNIKFVRCMDSKLTQF